MPGLFWIVPVAGVLTVLFVIWLVRNVLSRDTGTPKMREIGDIIFQGAWAFLKRQYTTIGIYSLVIAVIIGVLVAVLGSENVEGYSQFDIGWRTSVAFIVGALCSGVAGFISMYIAVKSNVRCASAAQRNLTEAVTVALRGGAVSGFLITALSLIGVTVIFFAFGGGSRPDLAPNLIVGFGFGASFVALFAQLGGGIYTKAADVGADLVGKVESGIPEDDPRNPAVIADLVGDNVGDCAGRGADLFESTAAENIGAMILGVAAYVATENIAWILFPLCVRGFGMIASIVGLLTVKAKKDENAMNALNRGYYWAIGLSVIGLFITVFFLLGDELGANFWWLFAAGIVGIIASIVIVYVTQYYTEWRYKPVRDIAEASKTGPATNIIQGMAVGFETTLATALIIGIALLLAFKFGALAMGDIGLTTMQAGAFGTAVATMGMLMTCPYILTMDTFGPITDNANGINEMAGAGPEVRKITDRLDAVGNTTKALTKGYAMVSAGLAAFLLFQAYIERVAHISGKPFETIDIAKIEVFVGALLAAMIVFFFSSLAIKAVGKTAQAVIQEVRRQFKADPEILNPKPGQPAHKPDYAKAVDITARAGLREMIAPGLIPVLAPVVIGVVFNLLGYDAPMVVGAVLMVGTIVGILMASFMNNGGGAWDNAKKMIEDGQLKDEKGNVIGKKTFAHAAAVVGDTLGDPLKDTAGPSLHVLVKLLATITLVMVPLFL